MRPVQHSRWSLAVAALLFLPAILGAQGGATDEGAVVLLLPTGARAVGLGQSTAALLLGAESVWINPAGLGKISDIEINLHHSQTIAGTGDAVTLAVPSSLLGVFAISASILNFGDQSIGDDQGATGTLSPRNYVFAATYATAFGSWVRAGLTYKLVQLRLDCSGGCSGVETFAASSSALDVGLQIENSEVMPLSVGVALRNAGPKLQVLDREQADPLPSRLHLGVAYRVTALHESLSDTELRLSTELIDRLKISRPAPRFGAELSYQERFFLRGGYVFEEGSGASVGFGMVSGHLSIDIARIINTAAADIGISPTYVSLKYHFR